MKNARIEKVEVQNEQTDPKGAKATRVRLRTGIKAGRYEGAHGNG